MQKADALSTNTNFDAHEEELIPLPTLDNESSPFHTRCWFKEVSATYRVHVCDAAGNVVARYEDLNSRDFLECVRGNAAIQA